MNPPQSQLESVAEPRHSPIVAAGSPMVDDTTEVRWFAVGPLPSGLVRWFTGDGMVGFFERRTDSYRLDDRGDVGVKRRSQRTLELKTRLAGPETFALGHGLAGRIESWRRWSPAVDLIDTGDDHAWVELHKTIIKRRFGVDGVEAPLSQATRAMTGAGCDVEVAAVELHGRSAWSFAFAGFGPVDGHRDSIRTAWTSLAVGCPWTPGLVPRVEESYGYPQWLARVATTWRSRPAVGPL